MTTTAKQAADIDRLKARIQALRAKTVQNGCTEQEALAAAAKVADLLDQHDLSLTDVEIREEPCERAVVETYRKQRVPLDGCVNAIAAFCDCRVWREKNSQGENRYVFFGLSPDVAVAHYIADLVLTTMTVEASRFKRTAGYLRYRPDARREGLRCRTPRGEVRGSISTLPHFPRIMEEYAAGLAEKIRFCRTAGHSAVPQPRGDKSCIKLARSAETANRYPRMSASLLSRLRDRTVRRPGPACVPAG